MTCPGSLVACNAGEGAADLTAVLCMVKGRPIDPLDPSLKAEVLVRNKWAAELSTKVGVPDLSGYICCGSTSAYELVADEVSTIKWVEVTG